VPNIKSAKKRVLVIEKKNLQNRSQMSALKTLIKKFNGFIDINDLESAEKMLPEVYGAIDKCCTKGIIHKNNAANKKAALAKRLSDVKSGKVTIVIKKDAKTIAAEKAKAAKEKRELAREESMKLAAEKKEAMAKAKAEKAEAKLTPAEKAKKEKADAKEKVKKEKETAKAKK